MDLDDRKNQEIQKPPKIELENDKNPAKIGEGVDEIIERIIQQENDKDPAKIGGDRNAAGRNVAQQQENNKNPAKANEIPRGNPQLRRGRKPRRIESIERRKALAQLSPRERRRALREQRRRIKQRNWARLTGRLIPPMRRAMQFPELPEQQGGALPLGQLGGGGGGGGGGVVMVRLAPGTRFRIDPDLHQITVIE